MNTQDSFSDESLYTLIDNELDREARRELLDAMTKDPKLRARVRSLKQSKDMVRLAFSTAEPPRPHRALPAAPLRLGRAVAASMLLMTICFGAGMLGYKSTPLLQDMHAAQVSEAQPPRLVLHVSESDPEHFSETLAFAERYLVEHLDQDAVVDVVVNAGGLDLLREDASPHGDRIRELMARYQNLQFMACMNTIRNLRRQGDEPILIQNVNTEHTAVDHIISRILDGWAYVKLDPAQDI